MASVTLRTLIACAIVAGAAWPPAGVSGTPSLESKRADFAGRHPGRAARTVADWIIQTHDNGSAAFFIVDKVNARLYVFDQRGKLQGASPVLLGLARGDDSAPGIGAKPLAQIADADRTTPAGRFVAERGRNAHGDDVVWVDYADAVSMHRVREVMPGEHRLRRLRTPTIADNRISYGCINVPADFYNRKVARAWKSGGVVVYVLPEVRPLEQVFPARESLTHASALLRRLG
jgi:hypothetical protein